LVDGEDSGDLWCFKRIENFGFIIYILTGIKNNVMKKMLENPFCKLFSTNLILYQMQKPLKEMEPKN